MVRAKAQKKLTKTLTSALRRTRKIHQRMLKIVEDVKKYSSMLSTVEPYFESEEVQRQRILELVQEGFDLLLEAINIRADIDYTNSITWVSVNGQHFRVAALLGIRKTLKRKRFKQEEGKTNCQLPRSGGTKTQKIFGAAHLYEMIIEAMCVDDSLASVAGNGAEIVKFYDERKKRSLLDEWSDLINQIDDILFDINSTTELLTPPIPEEL